MIVENTKGGAMLIYRHDADKYTTQQKLEDIDERIEDALRDLDCVYCNIWSLLKDLYTSGLITPPIKSIFEEEPEKRIIEEKIIMLMGKFLDNMRKFMDDCEITFKLKK